MAGTIHVYNKTSYSLSIIVDTDGTRTQSFNDPAANRVTVIRPPHGTYSKLTIVGVDKTGSVQKNITFFSHNDHSWIVKDDEIRRQAYGNPKLDAEDRVSANETDVHYRKENREKIKQYTW